jgi:ATP/maltotriose-dependent transcriptional regulator MalT
MELIERSGFLASMQTKFADVVEGEGHCLLICGEAGIGKTSIVKQFCKENKNIYRIYTGSCDALFTPRPLAPLYDIIWQLGSNIRESIMNITDRAELFTRFFQELVNQNDTTLIVIEDIHWADEATLDFIKFLARRITRLHCLLILTYRDNEIHSSHSLRTVLGQLPPDSFTRLQLTPLSRQAVEKMAVEKGYKGEDVYAISNGNPFYVNEILASYSTGIPDNIKDSILSFYNRLGEKTKQVLQILSVMPTGLELKYLEKIEPQYEMAIHNCLDLKILILNEGLISFKHELYRRTIETSLSPLVRIAVNKKILDLLLESLEENKQTERIVHHAKNANEYNLVAKYAPISARQSALVGSHIEASKLYLTAIEYYQGHDKDLLIQFYEGYAYECYLTNQIKEAIIYTTKALNIWKERNDQEKIGNSMRFLSRLWWFDGNRKKAEAFSAEAIKVFSDQPASGAKAMALSNQSQLKMLSDQPDECIFRGEKAIAMAEELADEEILCHALNNVGTMLSRIQSSRQKGIEQLQQSLEIALKNSYQEHAARAYTNLGNSGVVMRDYEFAKKILEPGITYCDERDLDSWLKLMYSLKARMNFETGNWDKAHQIGEKIIKSEGQVKLGRIDALAVVARIKMRRGEPNVLPLLQEAKSIASETTELQRMIPALVASLEYEWITGKEFIEKSEIDHVLNLVEKIGNVYENSEFAFWLFKARKKEAPVRELFAGYKLTSRAIAIKATEIWQRLGCPYEQGLSLFEGNENDKRAAITIMHKLGAVTIIEKMKFQMRTSGIKSIPRGIRKTTRSNPANLTERELDILQLLKEGLQNKEIASRLFISAKTVEHHISAIFYKLEVNSRIKAIQEASQLGVLK